MINKLQEARALLLKISKQPITPPEDLQLLSNIASEALNPYLEYNSIFTIEEKIYTEIVALAKLITPILTNSSNIFTKDRPVLQEFAVLILQKTATITDFQRDLQSYLITKLCSEMLADSIAIARESPIYDAHGNIVGTADLVVNVMNNGKIIKQFPIECDGSSHEGKDDRRRDEVLKQHFEHSHLIIKHGESGFEDYCETTGTTEIDNFITAIKKEEVIKKAKDDRLKDYQKQPPEISSTSSGNTFILLARTEEELGSEEVKGSKKEKPQPKEKGSKKKKQRSTGSSQKKADDEEEKLLAEAMQLVYKEREQQVKADEKVKKILDQLIENPSQIQEVIREFFPQQQPKKNEKNKPQSTASNTEFLLYYFDYLFDNDPWLALDLAQNIIEQKDIAKDDRSLIQKVQPRIINLLEKGICHPFLLNECFNFSTTPPKQGKDTSDLEKKAKSLSQQLFQAPKDFIIKLLTNNSNKVGIPSIENLFYTASWSGRKELVKSLLEKYSPPINNKDQHGYTALMLASHNGHKEVVELLLAIGAKVDCQAQNGYTALMLAIQNDHKEVAKLLLEKSAELPLEKSADFINVRGTKGVTALILAADKGHEEVVQLLLEKGAEVDVQTEDFVREDVVRTALMIASQNGHKEVVQLLLKKGAKVDCQAQDGYTALMIASQNGHKEVVQLLLKKGAKVDCQAQDGCIALIVASHNGHKEVVELLLARGAKVDCQAQNGYTALMLAAKKGHKEVVELLLEKSAEVDVQTEDVVRTALMIASQNGHKKVVELLLKKSAEVDAKEDTDKPSPTTRNPSSVKCLKKEVKMRQ